MPIYQSLYNAILKVVNIYNMINLLHNFYCLSILFLKLNTNCKVTNFSPDSKEIGSGNGSNKPNTINL